MGYYVLENKVHNYTRVHLADCPYCKHGAGPRESNTGCWYGEYNTFTKALAKVVEIGRPVATDCSRCGSRLIER